jgi:hypothetical protein
MIRGLALSSLFVMGAIAANAATLDFSELGLGEVLGSSASITGANLTSGADGFMVGGSISNSICAFSLTGSGCANDLTIDFTSLVSSITFDVGGFQLGDQIEVLAYGPGNALLGSVLIFVNGFYDLSAFSNVDYLYFDDSSATFGVEYGNVSYTAAAIPVPAGLPMLLAGLGGLIALRSRSRFFAPYLTMKPGYFPKK